MSICVLDCPPDMPVVLRSDPTREEIRSFVVEHNRRVQAGEATGWHEHLDPEKASPFHGHKIISARLYASESAWRNGESSGRAIKISDLDA